MARKEHRPQATHQQTLTPQQTHCPTCGGSFWVAYRTRRTILTLDGLWQLTLAIRRCHNPDCPRYHAPYRPEEEGRWALPHGEFGLDVIALIGRWRFAEHRSVPEIHQRLQATNIPIAERTVLNLVQRYEELVTLQLTNQGRLNALLTEQGRVILAIDGLQPDVGHEVLWIIRDCLSGEILLARALLSSTQGDLTALLREVKDRLPVPVRGIISDGQETIRSAVAFVFPDIPHQLCQFHYPRDAQRVVSLSSRTGVRASCMAHRLASRRRGFPHDKPRES